MLKSRIIGSANTLRPFRESKREKSEIGTESDEHTRVALLCSDVDMLSFVNFGYFAFFGNLVLGDHIKAVRPSRVDVHTHFVLPFYRQILESSGYEKPDEMPRIPVSNVNPTSFIIVSIEEICRTGPKKSI